DGACRPDLRRRRALVLRAELPVQARRDSRPEERVRPAGRQGRYVQGLLRRVLRSRSRPHDVHRQGREPRRLRRVGGRSIMTTVVDRPAEAVSGPEPRQGGLLEWLTTTDHKRIGLSYIYTAVGFFCIGGVLALLIRTQLAQPDQHLVDPDTYNEF